MKVSEVGLGAWQIGGPVNGLFEGRGRIAHGWGPVDDAESVRLIRRCGELGINFIDTAAGYGAGHSEEVVGEALQGEREDWVVETKGGEWFDENLASHHDFSFDRLTRQIDESLERLRTDYVDVYLLHGPSEEDVDRGDCLKALDRIRSAGKARATGVSLGSPELGLKLLRHDVVDVLQVAMNVTDVRMADELLPEAQARGVGVVVRGVMGSGYYTGDIDGATEFSEEDRRSWQKGADRGKQIAEAFGFLQVDNRTLTQSYIQYPLHFPGVSTVIVGSKRIEHMEANAGASDAPALTEADLARIAETRKEL